MALQNNLLAPDNPDISLKQYRGAGGYTKKFKVSTADLAALGAFTTGDVILCNLPPKAVILRTHVKPTVSVAGPSISAATARVITANNNYGTAFDVFQAVGDTVTDFDGTHPGKENYSSDTPLLLHVTSTGANLSVVNAGAIDVIVTWDVLPS